MCLPRIELCTRRDKLKKKHRIMVIDGNPENLEGFLEPLRRSGFEANGISDAESAREAYDRTRYSVVLVHYSPSNIRFCKWIRSIDHDTPIILICDRKMDCTLAEALDIGCDDYVVPPYKSSEIAARIRMVLRRIKRAERTAFNLTGDQVIKADGLEIDTVKRLVTVDGRPVKLTVTEFNILNLLASRSGRTYSRRDILNFLWDDEADVYEHTINSHINRLRSKIERDPESPKHIVTVWGVGYRFAGDRDR